MHCLRSSQCFVFWGAGFETSATAMNFALLLLAQHQDIQDKVRNEVLDVLKNYDGKITYDGIKSMTYLDQVLQGKYVKIFVKNGIF